MNLKWNKLITANTVFFFDMDGTLIDTDLANFLSYKKAIRFVTQNDFELSYNPECRFNSKLLRNILPNLMQISYERIIQKKEEFYKDFLYETKLNIKIANILHKYSKTNKTVLVTNSKKERALMTLNYFEIADKFSDMFFMPFVYNGDKINKFENAISKLGILPKNVIAFDNEEKEIFYAKKTGIKIINQKNI